MEGRFLPLRSPPPPFMPDSRSGFSLLDWLITTLVVMALAGVATKEGRLQSVEERDATRIQDHGTLFDAIQAYRDLTGSWPSGSDNLSSDGWSSSNKKDFLQDLVTSGVLPAVPLDPTDNEQHCYRYRVYTTDPFGCGHERPYFLLGVRRLETKAARAATSSRLDCQGRDFGAEYDLISLGTD